MNLLFKPKSLITALVMATALALTVPLAGQGVPTPEKTTPAELPDGKRGWLGADFELVSADDARKLGYKHSVVRVESVFVGSPADKAGLKQGDLILAIDGAPVRDPAKLQGTLNTHPIGSRVQLEVKRGAQTLKLTSVLSKRAKGWLGVSLSTVKKEDAQKLGYDHDLVRVDTIFEGSPAHASGIKEGDLFITINGEAVKEVRWLVRTVGGHLPGDKIQLKMLRGKDAYEVPILLGLRPDRLEMLRGRFLNKPAPAISVTPLDSKTPITLDSHKGKVMVLDFWATWCGPCRRAMPHLDDMSKRLSKDGLVILGVTDEELDAVSKFSTETPVSYALALDPNRKAHGAYNISALPTIFIVDHKGVVREVLIGGGKKNMDKLDATVATLLAERAADKP